MQTGFISIMLTVTSIEVLNKKLRASPLFRAPPSNFYSLGHAAASSQRLNVDCSLQPEWLRCLSTVIKDKFNSCIQIVSKIRRILPVRKGILALKMFLIKNQTPWNNALVT